MFCNIGEKVVLCETVEYEFLLISLPSLNWRTSLRVKGWAFGVIYEREFINLGENLEVIVMEQDLENRRLALSHKDINSSDSKKEETKKEKKK